MTCDVTVNHVHLIDVDIGYFDAQFRLDPPLRSQRDREAIRAGLADGTIDAICSDHTPVDDDEKLLPFAEATPGATGLELLLSLTVKWARRSGRAACEGAQPHHRRAGRRAEAGRRPASPWARSPISASSIRDATGSSSRVQLKSQGHNTPFLGYELPARVRATIVSGHVAFE